MEMITRNSAVWDVIERITDYIVMFFFITSLNMVINIILFYSKTASIQNWVVKKQYSFSTGQCIYTLRMVMDYLWLVHDDNPLMWNGG